MNILNVMNLPWAILPEKLNQMCTVLDCHLRGPKLNLKDIESKILAFNDAPQESNQNNIIGKAAIIEITGPLAKNPDIFDRVFFGASSMAQIKGNIAAALADSSVNKIILYIDSPGGTVDGTQELAQFIFENRGNKPIYAYTDGMIASAAYWIASATDKIYISGDTNIIGSIGVIATHTDYSEMDKQMGIKVTEIVSGKYKNMGSSNKPLADDARDYIQGQIDSVYSAFVDDVARNRGVDADFVLTNMADGKIFIGKQSIESGLVDGVSTIEGLIDLNSFIKTGGVLVEFENFKNEVKNMGLSMEVLVKDFPEVYNAVIEKGKAEAQNDIDVKIKAAEEKGRDAGIKAETERIKAVKEQLIPGHEALIEALMFDGKTTAEQAAVKILKAEKEKLSSVAKNLEDGAPAPVDQPSKPEEISSDESDDELTEEGAKVKWEKSKEIRAEFGTFDAYFAFMQNRGNIRIKGEKK
jgi:signal peptide peptidase SppA